MRTPKNQKNIFGSKSTGLLERWRKLFPDQLLKILTMKIFDPSHSLRAELVLLRGGLPSVIALQVQNCVSKGRCRFRKNRKYIFGSQGHMKRGENWFPKNYEQILTCKNIWSQSFSIRASKGRATASELVLLRRGLPSEIALQGGSLESEIVYRGVGADFEKP